MGVLYKNKNKSTNKPSLFPLLKDLTFWSQNCLTVLNSLIRNKAFLKLSETEILRILNESDKILVPKNTYECSIKFLVNQLLRFEKKVQLIKIQLLKIWEGYTLSVRKEIILAELIINYVDDVVVK